MAEVKRKFTISPKFIAAQKERAKKPRKANAWRIEHCQKLAAARKKDRCKYVRVRSAAYDAYCARHSGENIVDSISALLEAN